MRKGILLGPPGAGKGTQAHWLSEHLAVPLIATGETFRLAVKAGTDLGRQAEHYMNSGALVPDPLVIDLVVDRLEHCPSGFILDGFPRTLDQAGALEARVAIDWVVIFKVSDDCLIERLSQRRVHLSSGRVYHLTHHRPKEEGLDDETGEPLIQRDDDKPETIKVRLETYHRQTAPLIDFYQKRSDKVRVIEIDAAVPADQVRAQLQGVFV